MARPLARRFTRPAPASPRTARSRDPASASERASIGSSAITRPPQRTTASWSTVALLPVSNRAKSAAPGGSAPALASVSGLGTPRGYSASVRSTPTGIQAEVQQRTRTWRRLRRSPDRRRPAHRSGRRVSRRGVGVAPEPVDPAEDRVVRLGASPRDIDDRESATAMARASSTPRAITPTVVVAAIAELKAAHGSQRPPRARVDQLDGRRDDDRVDVPHEHGSREVLRQPPEPDHPGERKARRAEQREPYWRAMWSLSSASGSLISSPLRSTVAVCSFPVKRKGAR